MTRSPFAPHDDQVKDVSEYEEGSSEYEKETDAYGEKDFEDDNQEEKDYAYQEENEDEDYVNDEYEGEDTTTLENDHDVKGWFDYDPPGIDPAASSTIWAHEISLKVNSSRSHYQQQHPQFAFIKGLKVGGTTIAIALDHVARHFHIKLQRVTESANRRHGLDSVRCTSDGSLWFHHGYKNPWMSRCMPGVRFLTMLRDPVSQALSWETFVLSMMYYHHYPPHDCHLPHLHLDMSKGLLPHTVLSRLLGEIAHCRATEYRKNITLQLVAHRVSGFGNRAGMAVGLSHRWMTMGHVKISDAQATIAYLKTNYFLVGVTEYMNEFLVLLALHMGWDPSTMYYIYCKPTDLDIHRSEFAAAFPEKYTHLVQSTSASTAVYQAMKTEFETHLGILRSKVPHFDTLLKNFNAGLKAYQTSKQVPGQSIYRWHPYHYLDGHHEFC